MTRISPWRRPGAVAAARLSALLAVVVLSACVTITPITREFNPDGSVKLVKRAARNMTVAIPTRLSAKAYRTALGEDFQHALSPEEEAVLVDLGQPELLRIPFRSTENELTSEWVYLDKARIVQFVEGERVYEGPLTDYERVLIRNGYPDLYTEAFASTGEKWIYMTWKAPFSMKNRQIALYADQIVYRQEVN